MKIEQMSDRMVEQERHSLTEWIRFCSDEEVESGEVDSWAERLRVVECLIKERQERGKETR